MRPERNRSGYVLALLALLLFVPTAGTLKAQQADAVEQRLSPGQLDDLVAPIALYPDPLISQVLVAVTYPLELVEASQWLHRNPELHGMALTQAVRTQMWDSSVQGLIAFPEVLDFLMEDIAWTTTLGNAFLAQEGDVMDAIQRMRARAAASGRLSTSSQLQVTRAEDSGLPVYQVMPPEPEVIYVPVYDPTYIWGAATYYPYAHWHYPVHSSTLYFNRVSLGLAYGSGWRDSTTWVGWNDWGWRPAWGAHSVLVNHTFIAHQKLNGNHPSQSGTTKWNHDVTHRQGVPYSSPTLTQRFHSNDQPLNSRPGNLAVPQRGGNPVAQLPNNGSPNRTFVNNEPASRQNSPQVRNDGGQPARGGGAVNGFSGGAKSSPNPNAAAAVLSRIAVPAPVYPSGSFESGRGATISKSPAMSTSRGQTTIVNAGQPVGRGTESRHFTNIAPSTAAAATVRGTISNVVPQPGRGVESRLFTNITPSPGAVTATRGTISNVGQQAGRSIETRHATNVIPSVTSVTPARATISTAVPQAGRAVETRHFTNVTPLPAAAAPVRATISTGGQQPARSVEAGRAANVSNVPSSAASSGQSAAAQVHASPQKSVQQPVAIPVGSTIYNSPQTRPVEARPQSPNQAQTNGGGGGRGRR